MGTYKAGSMSSAQRHTPTVSGSPHKPFDEAILSDSYSHTLTHGDTSPWHRPGWINVALVTDGHTSF